MNSFNKYINITQDCEIMLVLKWLGNSDFIAIIPCIWAPLPWIYEEANTELIRQSLDDALGILDHLVIEETGAGHQFTHLFLTSMHHVGVTVSDCKQNVVTIRLLVSLTRKSCESEKYQFYTKFSEIFHPNQDQGRTTKLNEKWILVHNFLIPAYFHNWVFFSHSISRYHDSHYSIYTFP